MYKVVGVDVVEIVVVFPGIDLRAHNIAIGVGSGDLNGALNAVCSLMLVVHLEGDAQVLGYERLYIYTEEIRELRLAACSRQRRDAYSELRGYIAVPLVVLAGGLGVLLDDIHGTLEAVLDVLAYLTFVPFVDDLCVDAHCRQHQHEQ